MKGVSQHSTPVFRLVCILTLVCLIASGCLADYLMDPLEKEAKAAMIDVIAELPELTELELIGETEVLSNSDCGPLAFRDESDDCCGYAHFYRLYGTSLSDSEALNLYVEQLKLLNWQKDITSAPNIRILIRGSSELLALKIAPDHLPVWLRKIDPNNLRENYLTVLELHVTIKLPQRDGC